MRTFTAATSVVALIGGGLLAVTPSAAAGEPVPAGRAGTIEVWGATNDTPEGIPVRETYDPAGKGWAASGSGDDANIFAIDRDGAAARIKSNGSAALDVPAAIATQRFVSVDAFGTVAGGVTSDGLAHLWGTARGMDLGVLPTTTDGLGGKATQIRIGTTLIAVLLDNGRIGVLTTFGYELIEDDAGQPITGVVEIEVSDARLVVRTATGGTLGWTTDGVAAGWPAAVTGSPADPVVDMDFNAIAVAVTASGAVHTWDFTGAELPGEQFSDVDVDGKVVRVATTKRYAAAVTDQDEVVVWGQTATSFDYEEMTTVPEEVDGQDIAALDSGGNTFRVIVADSLPPLSVESPAAIAGTPQVGQTLTGTPATFAGAPNAVAHQWLADGAEIAGATGTTLALTEAHLGKTITFRSTATRGSDAPVTSVSAPVGPVTVASTPVKVASTTTVAVAPASAAYGTGRTVTVTVAKAGGTPTGAVAVTVAGTSSTLPLTAGRATLRLPATLPVGSHPVSASYAGDATTTASTGSASVVVAKAASRTKVTAVKVVKKGKKVTVQLKVSTPAGVKPSGKVSVVIKRGAKTVAKKSVSVNAGGVAKLTAKKLTKKGKYEVSASYGGSATLAASKATKAFKV